MSTLARALAVLPLLTPLATLHGAPARAEGPRALATRIAEVTVYADRAQVARTAVIPLSATSERYVVAGLPGWIDEDSVRATLAPPGTGRILDVTVERSFLAEASDEAVRQAEAAVLEVADRLAALADEEAVVQAEIDQLEAVRAFSLEKLPRDMATREVKVTTFGETVAFVSSALRRNRAALRELQAARRTLEPELRARSLARDDLRARAQLEQRSVVVEVDGKGRATLTLTYLTPGAAWEPVAELRASSTEASAALTQHAVVVQTTGEDWEGARLHFSTQRPAETLQVPEVQALLLGEAGAGLGEVLGRMGASFERAQSAYVAQSQMANRNVSGFEENLVRQQAIQQRSAATFSRLAQRGTTAHFEALGERPVRADGRPIRVPITASTFAVGTKLVAVPEVSLNAVRTAEIANTSGQPILPGKVALFVDGAFVGQTELPFVAPGETFSTYLGVHERVKLARGLDRKRSRLDRGKRETELVVSFLVTAENLADEPVTVELGDRVPVAGDEAIEVDDVRVPREASRDADGIVRWTATLPPRSTRTWRVGYRLTYPSDLLARAPAERHRAPAKGRMLFEDIESLEKQF